MSDSRVAEGQSLPVSASRPDLDALRGRIRDVDTHEMLPARAWVREYGPIAEPLVDFFMAMQSANGTNSFSVSREFDDEPVTSEGVDSSWGKGCLAAGAFDMKRRVEFMNLTGIDDSLIFGSMMSFVGQQFASEGGAWTEKRLGVKLTFLDDAKAFGRDMVRAHNDWCIRVAAISHRLRPVATILTHSLQEAVQELERVISGGVRAICVPAGDPIEGKAPAHPDNDIFWNLLAAHKVPALLHIGGEKAFLREHTAWLDAPQFAPNTTSPSEVSLDPVSFATCGLAAQNYLTNLVLGAVFERVPDLRCGVMELGGGWIGPTAENLDIWRDQFAGRFEGVLSMKPSDYVRRNVRVSPFTFEPVDKYIQRFPFLEDVYCFSTDYPHFEGGQSPIENMFERVGHLGPEVCEKFFVTNADWVMPR